MRDKDLYAQILGIKSPWRVSDDEREALPSDAFEPVRYTEWAPCNYWRYSRGRYNRYKSTPPITASIPTAARNKKRAGDDSSM